MQGFYSDEARTVMLYDQNVTTGDLIATGVEVATKTLSSLNPATSFAESAASVLEIQSVRLFDHRTARTANKTSRGGCCCAPGVFCLEMQA